MTELVLIWVGLLIVLVAYAGRFGIGGPLVLSYFLGLSLIHVPGALIYLDPLSIAPSRIETELGFRLTVIGMAAFVFGAVVARPAAAAAAPTIRPEEIVARYSPHVWPLIAAGFISYVFFMGRASAI